MRWLDQCEARVLDFIATVPFDTRKSGNDGFTPDQPEYHAMTRLEKRGLIFAACSGIDPHGHELTTYKLTTLGALIRSAIKSSGVSA